MNRDVCVCVSVRVNSSGTATFGSKPSRGRAHAGVGRRDGTDSRARETTTRTVGRTVLFRAREEEGERRRRRGRVGFISCAEESGNDERVNRIERTCGGWVAAAFIHSFNSFIHLLIRACVRA